MSAVIRSTRSRVLSHARPRAAALAGAVLALGGLAACGTSTAGEPEATSPSATAPSAAPTIVVGDAWVRATVGAEDTTMTGAFMTLDNEGADDVTLTGASSPVATMTEIHEMAMVDGATVMRKIEGGLEIEAGFGQVLMPGGNHVMLMGLTEELAPGDEVDLVLEFSDGRTQELTVPVKEFTEELGHYHPSASPHASMSPSGSPTQ